MTGWVQGAVCALLAGDYISRTDSGREPVAFAGAFCSPLPFSFPIFFILGLWEGPS